jgi:gamma-glutamyltranspeptidase / glutathione hydrolase
MKRTITLRLLVLVFACTTLLQGQVTVPVTGKNGMASTAHPLASEAAVEMLKAGGNAVDAAVAAAFAIGVVEPDGSGIGGGGGMVIYLKEQKESFFINYYGRSSENAESINFVSANDRPTGKSIGVPGTVAGLLMAHEKFGSLPLATIMEPAIRHAEQGFPIDNTLARLILDNIEVIMSDPATASVFLDEGFPRMEGDMLMQKDLAIVLKEISQNGRDAFYKGRFAEEFVKGIQARGGVLTLKDFSTYEPKISEPVKGNYRGYDVITAGLPQAGVSLVMGLNILENYDFSNSSHFTESAATLHVIAEALKLVTADRYAFVGDPDFVGVPLNGMLSKEYARERFTGINMNKLDPPAYRQTPAGDPYKYNNENEEEMVMELSETEGHTTTMAIIDKDGNAVALTQTLGLFFGSGQTVSGVLFNSAMTNYSYTKSNPNYLRNSKQCRSTITPTIIVKNDSPFLILGSPGAARIISTVLQLTVNIIDFGMNVEEANLSPRFFCQKLEDYLHVEGGISPDVILELERMGHSIKRYDGIDLFFGGAQMIMRDPVTGEFHGSADKRRGGSAIGY